VLDGMGAQKSAAAPMPNSVPMPIVGEQPQQDLEDSHCKVRAPRQALSSFFVMAYRKSQ
jgi:hypothetical protein